MRSASHHIVLLAGGPARFNSVRGVWGSGLRGPALALHALALVGVGCVETAARPGVDEGPPMQIVDSGYLDSGHHSEMDAGSSVDGGDGSSNELEKAGRDAGASSDAQGAFEDAGPPEDASSERDDADVPALTCLPPGDDGPCAQYPCQNGGSCSEVGAGYVCHCLPHWSGRDCEDMACIAGAIRCNAISRNAERCLADHTWHQVDVCSSPSELCRPGLGCVLNEPYEARRPNVDGWDAWDAENGRAYWYPLEVQRLVRAKHIRLYAGSSGGECKVALYADDGGTPGEVLTLGTSPVYVVADINGVGVFDAVELDPGRPYWIGVRCDAPGGSVRLLRQQNANAHAYQGVIDWDEEFEGSPRGECVSGVELPFFLVVQDV